MNEQFNYTRETRDSPLKKKIKNQKSKNQTDIDNLANGNNVLEVGGGGVGWYNWIQIVVTHVPDDYNSRCYHISLSRETSLRQGEVYIVLSGVLRPVS